MGESKHCYRCKETKPLEEFYKNKSKYDGVTSECKACIKIINKENKKKFPERVKKHSKLYYERHKEELSKRDHVYYINNREVILEKTAKYQKENRPARNIYRQEWRKKRKEQGDQTEHQYNLSPRGKYASYKGRANFKSIEFNLTFEEFSTFWQKPCSYCGSKIETVGIDRIDNNKGYSIENCFSCCTSCNASKADKNLHEWLDKMEQILKRCKRIPGG